MRLPDPMRRALMLEIGMQNAGLGAFLASTLFDGRDAIAIAPAMYAFGCMLTGTLLASVWGKIVPVNGGDAALEQEPHAERTASATGR
jgi:bile acid:Na+ symporter, BASS family